jgi:hypothetical protein
MPSRPSPRLPHTPSAAALNFSKAMPSSTIIELASSAGNSEDIEYGEPPSHDNCDVSEDEMDLNLSSSTKFAGHTVAPFLAKHIPVQYAPLGGLVGPEDIAQKSPSTKFCYRHRPDLKCRRTADEPTMENLQRVSTFPLGIIHSDVSGSRDFITGRPAGHLSCLVSFLCISWQTSKSHASGYPYPVLLSSTLLPLRRCERPHPDRLHNSSSCRGFIQDSLLP